MDNVKLRSAKDRVTVVFTIYHQVVGEQPTAIESRYFRFLETSEQTYTRWLKATPEWTAIDYGWINTVGMVVIENSAGKFTVVNPTPEQREEAAKAILEVSFDRDSAHSLIIRPGEALPICPAPGASLYIRSRHGVCRYTLNVLPG